VQLSAGAPAEGACVMCTDATPRVAGTPGLEAMPTLGCFVPGYLLVVPRAHVLSFGQLDATTLAEADYFIAALSVRLAAVYDMPVLAFEYGLATPGMRRIEHAHWHLLPTAVDLTGWLASRLSERVVGSLADLPEGDSYIAARGQDGILRVYGLGPNASQIRHRIRLRRVLAALDPRVPDDAWDWASHGHRDLMRQTVTDLTFTRAAVGASPGR
jgi:hypothetical protein